MKSQALKRHGGTGDLARGRVLAYQAQSPEFDPQHHPPPRKSTGASRCAAHSNDEGVMAGSEWAAASLSTDSSLWGKPDILPRHSLKRVFLVGTHLPGGQVNNGHYRKQADRGSVYLAALAVFLGLKQ